MTTCDNLSVAVVIRRPDVGGVLMIERADGCGWALPAGHVLDAHASGPPEPLHATLRRAAIEEVSEETGLTTERLTLLGVGGWRPNRCGRDNPGPLGPGHHWTLFAAEVVGDPRVTAEARSVTHLRRHELCELAAMTIGGRPGIEPVQLLWLVQLGLVPATSTALARIEERIVAGERR